MKIGGRSVQQILGAATERRHYHALSNMVALYPRFPQMLRRYLLSTGRYPFDAPVRTPMGTVAPTLYSHHDVLTVNEIFCREDYPAGPETRVVVDLGSNIGVSALYFLTRNNTGHCYLFEPVPANVERLRHNLVAYAGRYELSTDAVGDSSGEVEFGVEDTGRYGGIGLATGQTIRVRCRHVNEVLGEILEREGAIDILKIDTEGVEEATVRAIAPEHLRRIKAVYAEMPNAANPLAGEGFEGRRYGAVMQMFNRAR